MSQMPRILRARAEQGLCIRVNFADGAEVVVSLRRLLGVEDALPGVWATLESPEVFARVQVDAGGRYLYWPGEMDVCADAIWRLAQAQEAAA